jgi:hypothetical protein
MAGTNDGFDSAAFKAGIHFVMAMGAPPIADEQATFYFPSVLMYQSPEGTDAADDIPLDPSIPVTRTTVPSVKVPCAVEYLDANGVVTDFGLVTPSKAVVTLLDDDYVKVKNCSYVMLNGEKFVYRHTEFPSGLFDVGLYTMHFVSEDQS